MRVSSAGALEDELLVAAVEGAGVAPFEAELDDPEDGAGAVLLVVSWVEDMMGRLI